MKVQVFETLGNYSPVPLQPLIDILSKHKARESAVLFVDEIYYTNGRTAKKINGWVLYNASQGILSNLQDGSCDWLCAELDPYKTKVRLLQPGEALQLSFRNKS